MAEETAVIIALPLIASAIFLWSATVLDQEQHGFLKTILIIFSLGMIFPSIGFAFVHINSAAYDTNLTSFLWIMIFLAIILLIYFAFYFLIKLFNQMRMKKEGDLKY